MLQSNLLKYNLNNSNQNFQFSITAANIRQTYGHKQALHTYLALLFKMKMLKAIFRHGSCGIFLKNIQKIVKLRGQTNQKVTNFVTSATLDITTITFIPIKIIGIKRVYFKRTFCS